MYLVSPSRILRCDEWTAQPRGLHFFSLYHILACACQHSQKAPWHQNVVNQESSISDSSCLMLYALIVTLQEHESYKDAHVKVSKRCRLRGKLFHKYQGYHTTHYHNTADGKMDTRSEWASIGARIYPHWYSMNIQNVWFYWNLNVNVKFQRKSKVILVT